ncbi:MAG: hypothetical protein EG826_17965, partial [Deltaproteobacteria bacterium]|nr:hypothetical protein [Deltaproteobacteria bacterium]
MKKGWLALLALGLITAASTTVFALDVKFSGEFYAAGLYLDKTTLNKSTWTDSKNNVYTPGPSTAFYYQRLRVRTDFVVTSGLTLITRFDALERVWGAARSTAGATPAADSAGTRAENENIAFDWAYINYKSPIGVFDVGYMNDGATGTIFGNSYAPAGRIKYSYISGPVTLNAAYTKVKEAGRTAVNPSVATTDQDNDKYGAEIGYSWKQGRAGFQVNYYDYANTRPPTDNYKRTYFVLTPYAIAKIGPVSLQTEINYLTGYDKSEVGAPDVKLENWSGWVEATADFGKLYFGGTIAYVSGNDPGTTDKNEGGILNGGRDWSPCLIMWNYERTNWAGVLTGYDGAAQDTSMSNSWFFQAKAGLRPIDALDITASVSYTNADKKPSGYLKNDYGYELDLIAAYKITNNLTYMLGAGYLFTGDYYKGKSDANS